MIQKNALSLSVLALIASSTLAQAVPTNVALNQPAAADSLLSAIYPAANAVDGNSTSDASRWLSADTAPPHWIEIDLEQTYSLSQLKFWTGHLTQGPKPLDDFALQYWNGTGWTDLYAETGSTDDDGMVDVSFGPTVAGNRIRFNVTAVDPLNGDNIVRLYEIEVYGEPHGLSYTSLSPANGGTLFSFTDDLVVTFNTPVAEVDLTAIRIENLDTSTDLAGVSASVSGDQLLISHGGLAVNTAYAVHVPDARIASASDPLLTNGALYWEFETAYLKPQLSTYTSELPGLTGDLEFEFDRPVTLVNSSGVTIRRASDNLPLGGIVTSVSGNILTVAHDALTAEEAYIVVIEAGTVTGDINGAGNEELRRAVYGGSAIVFSSSFTTGLEGFQLAKDLFPGDALGNTDWKRVTTGTGPAFDSLQKAERYCSGDPKQRRNGATE